MAKSTLSVALSFAALASLTACMVEDDHHDYVDHGPAPTASSQTDGGASASTTPLLVDVDANQTLTASPGAGVGVFVEYVTGGHWHVWWTCDTNVSNLPCAFDVKVSVASGALAKVTTDGSTTASTTASLTTPTPASLEAQTSTTTGQDGVTFDAPRGGIITLDAAVGGVHDGSLLFFVENGQVNGGYKGTLTDPIDLEASAP